MILFVSDTAGARSTNLDFPSSFPGINVDDQENNNPAIAADPKSPCSVFISGAAGEWNGRADDGGAGRRPSYDRCRLQRRFERLAGCRPHPNIHLGSCP
jgi:hypothetical protein